ncbi:MAG: hypothetical protein JWO80_4618, partial [Bryobacterales bacterium]|nr:hypothetical protein [Bryobacterales bacterium]
MKLYLPEGVGHVELAASTGGTMTLAGPGYYSFIEDLGPADGRTLTMRFTLDRALPGDA